MGQRRCLLLVHVLALLVSVAPAVARAQEDRAQLVGTLYGTWPAQFGTYGDIYERTGRGGGAEVEFQLPEGWSSVAIFEDVSFNLGHTGHVIEGTADSLVGGVPGSLSLGRGALRHYWGRPASWRVFAEGGLGTGIAMANYTKHADRQEPGEVESLVWDAFVGLGVRRYLTKWLDGTLGLRVDGLSSIERDGGVLASLHAGISMKFGSVATQPAP